MKQALVAAVLASLATGLGGAFIAVWPRIPRRVYDAMLGFSAGVMLAAGSITLLWPAMQHNGIGVVTLGLFCGSGFVFVLERGVPHLEPHFAPELTGPEKRLGLLLGAALTLHHIPEGLAMGVAFAGAGARFGTIIAVAIALQNIPEGLAVAMPLRAAGFPAWKAIALATLSGLVQPVAALAGIAFVHMLAPVVPFALAMAAGAMIFVASDQLIPESRHHPEAKAPSIGLICGFVLVAVLTKVSV